MKEPTISTPSAEEAIVRKVLEETGVQMEIDRLGFVHENYFYGDVPSNLDKLIYEISFYFYKTHTSGGKINQARIQNI